MRRAPGPATYATAGIAVAVLAGCTAGVPPRSAVPAPRAAADLRLVAFDSCADALAELKAAGRAAVGPWGFGADDLGGAGVAERAAAAPGAGPAAGAPDAAAPGHSGTNNQEAGVDEPDLVKTDGKRIVVVNRGVLRVVDPAGRRVTGQLDLAERQDDPIRWAQPRLLLQGDHVLVLTESTGAEAPVGSAADLPEPAPPGRPAAPPDGVPMPTPVVGTRLLLVDLTGAPRVIADYRTDGQLLDARQTGTTGRIVVRSAPRITFRPDRATTDTERNRANRETIDRSTVDDWLPRFELREGGRTRTGQVGCDRVTRPAAYSGATMLTVLSFDLAGHTLGDGDPVTVLADGDTVYSTGQHLWIADDQRRHPGPMLRREAATAERDGRTRIYQFDTAGTGRPRYVAAGEVPGWLVNRYALGEWNGHLRVATTTGRPWETGPSSSSAVYVLRTEGERLAETGRVTGLGRGERIYSVRFTGPTGQVVTFRQTDPLYTLDLRDPRAPKVTGELKITGYSAYLHPLGDGRLIGVGQEASEQGRTQGTQVSLFDVRDPARPVRLARHLVEQGHSEAEYDPHAFLWWPADRLLVLPLEAPGGGGALVLRVGDQGFTELGRVTHPAPAGAPYGGQIRRSLVVGGALWTVSDTGLMASSLDTVRRTAWLPEPR